MDNILVIILATILIATLLNVTLKRFDIPTVIGYVFSGLIISQIFGLQNEAHNESLHQLAEFGIVFLMFTIGLEFSIRHLKSMKREVLLFGTLQMLVTGNLFGAFLHEILKVDLKSSIIVGFSLALSSTAIVLKILTEKNEIHSGFGRVVLGILLFQDIAVIPILLMLSIFTTPNKSISVMLFNTAIDMVVLLAIIFIFGKYILERFLEWTLLADSEEIFLLSALMIVIGSSYLAHSLGFSFSLGAFLAGMTLSETRFKYRIESDLLTFRDIFLGIFFVTIGMQIEPKVIFDNYLIITATVVSVMIIKAIVLFAILSIFLQKRTALKSALALMQIGEFALAIFAIASQSSVINPELNQIMVVVVVISMILTPFIVNNLKNIADFILKNEPEVDIPIVSAGYDNHIIILGYGTLGEKLSRELKKLSIPYIIVEHDYRLVKEAQEREEPIILANASANSVLKEIAVDKARAVIVAIENPAKTRMVVDAVTRVAPYTNLIVAVKNKSHQRIIETFNVNHIINISDILSEAILKEALNS